VVRAAEQGAKRRGREERRGERQGVGGLDTGRVGLVRIGGGWDDGGGEGGGKTVGWCVWVGGEGIDSDGGEFVAGPGGGGA
jgi:hypothetical protein